MKYNNLIIKINNFYKIAGLLKYPVKMHKEIFDWISSVYCSYIIDELNDMISSRELEGESLEKAKNFKKFLELKVKPGTDSTTKKFKLDLSGIEYLSEDIKHHPQLLEEYITVVFLPYTGGSIMEESDSFGEFDPSRKLITIKENIPKQISPSNLNAALKNLSNTIRHELQHVAHYYAQIIKNVSWQYISTPSTKVAPTQTIEEEQNLPARLKNIEFYTHLSDTVDNLLHMFQLFPKKLHKVIFDTLLGNILLDDFIDISINTMNKLNPSEKMNQEKFYQKYYFYIKKINEDAYEYKLMKIYQPEKYKKLIKELYKALGDYLS
jgi:hypothetical protein